MRLDPDVFVFLSSGDSTLMAMFVRFDQSFALFGIHEHSGGLRRFSEAKQLAGISTCQLTVKLVVEIRFLVDISVVNVNRGEEELATSRGKLEGHRMNFPFAFFQFEHSESIFFVRRKFVPGPVW